MGRHIQLTCPTTPATSAERRHDTAEWPTRRESHRRHAVQDRTGSGLPAAVLGTVPTADTRAALCCLTPAPRTARHEKSSPGPCSLEIDVQNQLLPPSLGYPLPGSYSLGACACRAPHDGSASASTGPQFSTLSTLWHRHVARRTCHTLRQAAGAPTSRTRPSSCSLRIIVPAPSHQPGLGTPHLSNLQ